MEHRFSPRLSYPLDVAIYVRNTLVARGVCRDVSRDGMFVYLDADSLSRNALVEVEIVQPNNRLCLPAMVAHCENDGVGLIFDEAAEPQALQIWWNYVRALRQKQAPSF